MSSNISEEADWRGNFGNGTLFRSRERRDVRELIDDVVLEIQEAVGARRCVVVGRRPHHCVHPSEWSKLERWR